MSHGGGDGETIDPNLTPLLDLVLQLLMLFMIAGNYASESNDPVKLARSETAQPADTESTQPKNGADQNFLFVTVKPYHTAEGVRQSLKAEINRRGANNMLTPEAVGHRLLVTDQLADKLLHGDNLDDEERQLLQEMDIANPSEDDLAHHVAAESRDFVLPKFKDGDAYVIVPGTDAMKPDAELQEWLKKQFDLAQGKANGQIPPVVIRPAADMDYAVVYRILKLCKDAGFTNLKVRALIAQGTQT